MFKQLIILAAVSVALVSCSSEPKLAPAGPYSEHMQSPPPPPPPPAAYEDIYPDSQHPPKYNSPDSERFNQKPSQPGVYQAVNPEDLYNQQQLGSLHGPQFPHGTQQQQGPNSPHGPQGIQGPRSQIPLRRRVIDDIRGLAMGTTAQGGKSRSPALQNFRSDIDEATLRFMKNPHVAKTVLKTKPHIESAKAKAMPLLQRVSSKIADRRQRRRTSGAPANGQMPTTMNEPYQAGGMAIPEQQPHYQQHPHQEQPQVPMYQ